MKTHCIHGHEYTKENTYVDSRGNRSCRRCRTEQARSSKQKNPVTPEKSRATSRRWWAKKIAENPNFRRDVDLWQYYRLTRAEYDAKVDAQKNCCAICNRIMEKPCVDHDHKTHQNRDLLCRECNLALGHIRDDIEVARSVLAYLERWKEVQDAFPR